MRRVGALSRVTIALAAAFSAAAWATPSQAATTTITYEITGGTVSGGDLFNAPVQGGSWMATYQAKDQFNGQNTLLNGPAVLNTLSLLASGYTGSGSFFDIVNVFLASPVVGNGTSGTGFNAIAAAMLAGTVNQHCLVSATECALFDLVPSVAQNFALIGNAANFSLNGANGNAVGAFSIPAQMETDTFMISFTGREISRTQVVPEPHTSALLGLGLALLAGGGRRLSGGRRPA